MRWRPQPRSNESKYWNGFWTGAVVIALGEALRPAPSYRASIGYASLLFVVLLVEVAYRAWRTRRFQMIMEAVRVAPPSIGLGEARFFRDLEGRLMVMFQDGERREPTDHEIVQLAQAMGVPVVSLVRTEVK